MQSHAFYLPCDFKVTRCWIVNSAYISDLQLWINKDFTLSVWFLQLIDFCPSKYWFN